MTTLQRRVLLVSITASFVAFLDSSVVNVALPAIARELGGGLATQQWVVDAYLVMLGAFILLAGSLSDLFGRRRILSLGLVGFGVVSLLCAIAPNSNSLIIFRALQGLAGALLVPSSLALIMSTFSGASEGKAIGIWTAWTGVSFIFGPLLGGFLVDSASWRFIFAINILPIVFCLWLLQKIQYDARASVRPKLDIIGAVLCSLGLSGSVFGLIEQPHYGWNSSLILASLSIGVTSLLLFVWREAHTKDPMLPLALFKIRNFSAGNIATLSVYGGLSVASFLIVIFLQQVGGYSALAAGFALLPVTLVMFVLSPRFGGLAGKYGPRLFMTVGPLLAGVGFLLMLRVDAHVQYWPRLFPGVMLFGLGLSMTVAPLTTAVLADVGIGRPGIASAVNNAIARIAGLITIAFMGVITGVDLNVSGFHRALVVVTALLAAGGVASWIGIRNHQSASRTQ